MSRLWVESHLSLWALSAALTGSRILRHRHVLVPGSWTVRRGHDLSEELERDIVEALPMTTVFVHIEPLEDEASFRDQGLDRPDT
jgi:divalent metal cation (Fe/Co/Zn/Cd) transporter